MLGLLLFDSSFWLLGTSPHPPSPHLPPSRSLRARALIPSQAAPSVAPHVLWCPTASPLVLEKLWPTQGHFGSCMRPHHVLQAACDASRLPQHLMLSRQSLHAFMLRALLAMDNKSPRKRASLKVCNLAPETSFQFERVCCLSLATCRFCLVWSSVYM